MGRMDGWLAGWLDGWHQYHESKTLNLKPESSKVQLKHFIERGTTIVGRWRSFSAALHWISTSATQSRAFGFQDVVGFVVKFCV